MLKNAPKKKALSAAPISAASALHDSRVDCYSIMLTMTAGDYLGLVEAAYQNRGGIEGQREKLRTTSAMRIRRRMVDDIALGAVLPPVVVGAVIPKQRFATVKTLTARSSLPFLRALETDRISIIDGMQRTTAIKEAISAKTSVRRQKIRVELWVSASTNSLIYRMLVLNTGQVPWNLRSQVEIVFRSLILEISEEVKNIDVLQVGDERRRSKGGQFQANELVELFLVFGARKEKIDIRERLADEFTRLDFIDAAADEGFTADFAHALQGLVKLDVAFDEHKLAKAAKDSERQRFTSGKDLFASQPACVGFITAVATEVFGRPGITREVPDKQRRLKKIASGIDALVKRLGKMDAESLRAFLSFQTLNEAIMKGRAGLSVGDMEREFFLKSFQVLIEEGFSVSSLTPCWRAY